MTGPDSFLVSVICVFFPFVILLEVNSTDLFKASTFVSLHFSIVFLFSLSLDFAFTISFLLLGSGLFRASS